MSAENFKDRKIGALWVFVSKTPNKQKFLKGQIIVPSTKEKLKIIIFKNQNKNKEDHPDWEILLQEFNAQDIE